MLSNLHQSHLLLQIDGLSDLGISLDRLEVLNMYFTWKKLVHCSPKIVIDSAQSFLPISSICLAISCLLGE